jgi:hypothetical protein
MGEGVCKYSCTIQLKQIKATFIYLIRNYLPQAADFPSSLMGQMGA